MRACLAAASLLLSLASIASADKVRCGIDVLAEREFAPLLDKRVGVITNQTGVDANGTHLVRLLLDHKIKIVKLFSPEHGLYGVKDEKVGDSVDTETGLPVRSLYGKTRRPTDEMLKDVDVLVFDIQDAGTRFYTYISTMGLCMEEAGKRGIPFLVLDRPNPISGTRVEGPIADEDQLGFTAYRPIPLVHGMTIGELAALFNAEYKLNVKLDVIPLEGWKRTMYFGDTGVKWINPSPNLRSPTQALLYPAIGLLEASNVSVGRGTDTPFELFGAPYINGEQLAAKLTSLKLPGVSFAPVTFTPQNNIHKLDKTECHGVRVTITDRDQFDSTLTGMCFAWTLDKLYPGTWEREKLLRMAQNKAVVEKLFTLDDPTKANALWQKDLDAWKQVRAKYLRY